jgi:hypothetical protein
LCPANVHHCLAQVAAAIDCEKLVGGKRCRATGCLLSMTKTLP